MPRKRPKKLITLDTETYNGLKGDLKRIAIYDGVEVTYGYKFEDIEPKINEWYNLLLLILFAQNYQAQHR